MAEVFTSDHDVVPGPAAARVTPERERIPVHERKLPGNETWLKTLGTRVSLFMDQKRGVYAAAHSREADRVHLEAGRKALADSIVQGKEGVRNRLRKDGRDAQRDIQRMQRSARTDGFIERFINRQKIRYIINIQEPWRRTKAAWVGSSLAKAQGKQGEANMRLERAEAARQRKMAPFLERIDDKLGKIDPILNEVNENVRNRENSMRELSGRVATLRAQCQAREAELDASSLSDADYERAEQAINLLWRQAENTQEILDTHKKEYETLCAHRDRAVNAHSKIMGARRRISAGYQEARTGASPDLPSEREHLDRVRVARADARDEFNRADDEDIPFSAAIRGFAARLAEAHRDTEVPKDKLLKGWNQFANDELQIDNLNSFIKSLPTEVSVRNSALMSRISAGNQIKVRDFESLILAAYEYDDDFVVRMNSALETGEAPRDYLERFAALSPDYIRI